MNRRERQKEMEDPGPRWRRGKRCSRSRARQARAGRSSSWTCQRGENRSKRASCAAIDMGWASSGEAWGYLFRNSVFDHDNAVGPRARYRKREGGHGYLPWGGALRDRSGETSVCTSGKNETRKKALDARKRFVCDVKGSTQSCAQRRGCSRRHRGEKNRDDFAKGYSRRRRTFERGGASIGGMNPALVT